MGPWGRSITRHPGINYRGNGRPRFLAYHISRPAPRLRPGRHPDDRSLPPYRSRLFENRDRERDHCHNQGGRSYIITDSRRVLAAEGRIVRVARGGVSYANPSGCPHVEPIARQAFLFFGPTMSGEALASSPRSSNSCMEQVYSRPREGSHEITDVKADWGSRFFFEGGACRVST
jgi:hypothetical protein